MDFISQFGGSLVTLVSFIVVIGIVVTFHEFGHYIVARWVGIHAEVFSVGFGKPLLSRTDKRGTVWQVAMIPLGGYVKFLGDRDASSATDDAAMADMNDYDRRRSFPAASVWRRALTVAAGPFANFLLSILIFASLVMWRGVADERPYIGTIAALPVETGLQTGDLVLSLAGQPVDYFRDIYTILDGVETPGPMDITVDRNGNAYDLVIPYLMPPLITGIVPLSSAFNSDLQVGDYILRADGVKLDEFQQIRGIVENAQDREIMLDVLRNGQAISLPLTPAMQDFPDGEGGFTQRIMIGVYGAVYLHPQAQTPGPWLALQIGVEQTYSVITNSLSGMKHIILGNISAKNLQGPIGIAQISGATIKESTFSYIALIATISTAIGLLNLFPIPVLDGGHLVTFAYEALRGRPPNPKFMQVVMTIGLVLLLSLMVFASYNDVLRL